MVRVACALLLLAVASASASPRIVGGIPSSVDKFPSIVQVQQARIGVWSQNGAGVVLTSRFVLSTCSNFIGPDFMIQVRRIIAGSSYRNVGGQIRNLARVIRHPLWEEGLNFNGDIAIVELDTPLQFTPVVQQASILGQGAFVPDNMPGIQTGWGMTFNEDFPSIFPNQLQELNVITVNNQLCTNNFANLSPIPGTVTNNMICAGALVPSGACVGDRGSPLYIQNIVVGLVSWGRGCTNATFPTVHTAVPSFTNWIVANAV